MEKIAAEIVELWMLLERPKLPANLSKEQEDKEFDVWARKFCEDARSNRNKERVIR